MRDQEPGAGEKDAAARRRARRRRERGSVRGWLAPVMERFSALTTRQRSMGLAATALVILLLALAVILPGLAARRQMVTRATQTAAAALLTASVPTSTPRPTPTLPPPEMACAYQILPGDALGTVFDGFGIGTIEFPGPYSHFEQCSPTEAPSTCASKKPIPNVDLMEPGWWIEIPGMDQARCEENDGLWIEIKG